LEVERKTLITKMESLEAAAEGDQASLMSDMNKLVTEKSEVETLLGDVQEQCRSTQVGAVSVHACMCDLPGLHCGRKEHTQE
jgi:hypothetical protein